MISPQPAARRKSDHMPEDYHHSLTQLSTHIGQFQVARWIFQELESIVTLKHSDACLILPHKYGGAFMYNTIFLVCAARLYDEKLVFGEIYSKRRCTGSPQNMSISILMRCSTRPTDQILQFWEFSTFCTDRTEQLFVAIAVCVEQRCW